jgi:hypothetical protein
MQKNGRCDVTDIDQRLEIPFRDRRRCAENLKGVTVQMKGMFTTISLVDEDIHNSSIRNELITIPITLSDR